MNLILSGITLDNAYVKAGSEKYPETGYYLQFFPRKPLGNGEEQIEMVSLKVPIKVYQHCIGHVGEQVSICVSPYSKEGGGIGYSYPKGEVPLPKFAKAPAEAKAA